MKKILLSVLCLCALCTAALFLNSKADSTLLNETKTCSADTEPEERDGGPYEGIYLLSVLFGNLGK